MNNEVHWNPAALNTDTDISIRDFRSAYQSLVAPFQMLKLDWPDAEQSLRNLFDYVSTGICLNDTGKPLIYSAAVAALEAHANSVSATETDGLRMIRFQQALFETLLPVMARLRIVTSHGEWSIHQAESLTRWIEHDDDISLHLDLRLDDEYVYRALNDRFLTPAQCHVIRLHDTCDYSTAAFLSCLSIPECA